MRVLPNSSKDYIATLILSADCIQYQEHVTQKY